MHSLLSICMNEKKSFTKIVWMLELIMTFGQTNYVIKSRRRQTKYQAVSFKWDTVQDVVFLQNRKNSPNRLKFGLNVFL